MQTWSMVRWLTTKTVSFLGFVTRKQVASNLVNISNVAVIVGIRVACSIPSQLPTEIGKIAWKTSTKLGKERGSYC